MRQSILKYCVITAILLTGAARGYCQNALPNVFEQGTISEQLKYLDERARIYENYRAIREDMFRIISRNTMDTLTKSRRKINGLILRTTTLENRIDSLKKNLEVSNIELKEITRTKESINVLGIEVNKKIYNSVMWTMVGVLVLLLLIGFLSFKQNRAITLRTKKDLKELKDEFEEYRKKTRLEREKMTIDHFNEIKKLKGR